MKRLLIVLALSAPLVHASEKPNPWSCAPGQVAPEKFDEQKKVLETCALRGNPGAMFLLANRIQDKRMARMWLLRAAELEHAESLYQLGLEEQDPRLAAQYMKAAAHALKHRHE